MKHVVSMSKSVSKGDVFQDFLCVGANMIAGIVEAKGGTSPIVQYIDEKCDLPEDTN